MKERLKPLMIKKSELAKNSVNTRIQGTAAVMSKLAGIYFFDWILKKGLFGIVKVPIFVHDEWVAECPEKYAEEVAKNLQECMERAGKHCLKHLSIKADPKIVKHWEK
jgi:DNA polymerase I-like protein with 3'-5' exonuclease and polymerase domains